MDKEIYNYFTNLIEKISGISYNLDKEYLIEKKLNELAQSLGYKDIKELYLKAKSSLTLNLLDDIIDALTTNETYFFRDNHPFEALKNYIFPELLKRQKEIFIWSAGCSTGQEPYTIAMILIEYFSQYLATHKIFIYATDISKKSLERAKKGIYNPIEINRGLSENFLIKYFKKVNVYWKIDDKIKKMVKFEHLNLLEIDKKVKQNFDIIFCRYVLIYFSEEIKKKVFISLWNKLKPKGYLFLGATEFPPLTFSNMERKIFGKTICYCKK